ncbi:TPA: hypothetical protein N0F65_006138 [Lagenidium giganteum]|uniref:Uncharacterized protein n=1 Tax=Lagenidium giganteum TaxID=4803 RepID=A0AAV2Z1T2_9STRA|nr:TPA: hypothetical protein N0F65_006138 [Lagenidium giganteum]
MAFGWIVKASLLGLAVACGTHSAAATTKSDDMISRVLRDLRDAVSLQLQLTVKRDAMEINAQHRMDAIAQIVTDSEDPTKHALSGFAVIHGSDSTAIWQMNNNVPTISTQATGAERSESQCVPIEALPPFQQLFDAIATSAPESSSTISCAGGHTYAMEFAGEPYVLCVVDTAGISIVSSDIELQVAFSSDALLPLPSETTESRCERLPALTIPDSANPTKVLPARRNLREAACSCRGRRRPCVFFHGMDVAQDRGLQDDSPFFGDIKNHAPCCSSVKFAFLNTVDFGWNDAHLQKRTCELALQAAGHGSNAPNRTISDTIVVAHSMGNLMLASAIANGHCQMDASSDWVALSAPMKGSMGADLQRKICDGGDVGKDIVKAVSQLFGQCPASVARRSLVYQGETYCSPALDQAYSAAQAVYRQHVSAAVCSESFMGLLSKDQLPLMLGGAIIPHKSKQNDGVVEFQSCLGGLASEPFHDHFTSRFYRAKLNHIDTRFAHGDALFNSAQKPVKWFECLL